MIKENAQLDFNRSLNIIVRILIKCTTCQRGLVEKVVFFKLEIKLNSQFSKDNYNENKSFHSTNHSLNE